MKKYFFTGLGILLPLVLTIVIVGFLINLLTRPFIGIAQNLLDYYGLLGKSFFFLSTDQLVLIISKLLVLAILILFTIFIGMLGKLFFVNFFFKLGDKLLHKIPIINKVYKAIKDVVSTIFESPDQNFSQVVLAPFPHTKGLAIGMVVKDHLPEGTDEEYSELVSVFVPATPNPTMGFMLLYRKSQLVFLDMKVEDALRAIVSCGVMFSNPK